MSKSYLTRTTTYEHAKTSSDHFKTENILKRVVDDDLSIFLAHKVNEAKKWIGRVDKEEGRLIGEAWKLARGSNSNVSKEDILKLSQMEKEWNDSTGFNRNPIEKRLIEVFRKIGAPASEIQKSIASLHFETKPRDQNSRYLHSDSQSQEESQISEYNEEEEIAMSSSTHRNGIEETTERDTCTFGNTSRKESSREQIRFLETKFVEDLGEDIQGIQCCSHQQKKDIFIDDCFEDYSKQKSNFLQEAENQRASNTSNTSKTLSNNVLLGSREGGSLLGNQISDSSQKECNLKLTELSKVNENHEDERNSTSSIQDAYPQNTNTSSSNILSNIGLKTQEGQEFRTGESFIRKLKLAKTETKLKDQDRLSSIVGFKTEDDRDDHSASYEDSPKSKIIETDAEVQSRSSNELRVEILKLVPIEPDIQYESVERSFLSALFAKESKFTNSNENAVFDDEEDLDSDDLTSIHSNEVKSIFENMEDNINCLASEMKDPAIQVIPSKKSSDTSSISMNSQRLTSSKKKTEDQLVDSVGIGLTRLAESCERKVSPLPQKRSQNSQSLLSSSSDIGLTRLGLLTSTPRSYSQLEMNREPLTNDHPPAKFVESEILEFEREQSSYQGLRKESPVIPEEKEYSSDSNKEYKLTESRQSIEDEIRSKANGSPVNLYDKLESSSDLVSKIDICPVDMKSKQELAYSNNPQENKSRQVQSRENPSIIHSIGAGLTVLGVQSSLFNSSNERSLTLTEKRGLEFCSPVSKMEEQKQATQIENFERKQNFYPTPNKITKIDEVSEGNYSSTKVVKSYLVKPGEASKVKELFKEGMIRSAATEMNDPTLLTLLEKNSFSKKNIHYSITSHTTRVVTRNEDGSIEHNSNTRFYSDTKAQTLKN